jgi:hypothetical protein
MRLLQSDPLAALLGLRAMKTVASVSGSIGSPQRMLLEAVRRVILRIDADLDTLAPIAPAEFAAGFPSPALRRQFVNGMLVVALTDGVPSRATVSTVAAFAEALGIGTPELTDLRRLTEHQMVLFKLDFLRRSQVGDIMRNQLDQHGVLGLAKSVLGLRGLIENADLAARYRAWEKLPMDTLGHAMWRYFDHNHFGVPGERGGFPEAGVYHDVSHVLGGYDTDPEGEIEVASFTGEFRPVQQVGLLAVHGTADRGSTTAVERAAGQVTGQSKAPVTGITGAFSETRRSFSCCCCGCPLTAAAA